MKHQAIKELAAFLDATEEQVEYWDGRLADYFADNAHELEQLRTGCPVTRYNVWVEGVKVAKLGIR